MTQHQKIAGYCKVNDGITIYECYDHLHITKCNTRVGEMEKDGYVFTRTWENSETSRWLRYRLISEPVEPVNFVEQKHGQYAWV